MVVTGQSVWLVPCTPFHNSKYPKDSTIVKLVGSSNYKGKKLCYFITGFFCKTKL